MRGKFTEARIVGFPAARRVLICLFMTETKQPGGRAGALIRRYHMEPIPHEGAWFSPSWVAGARAEPGGRAAGSAIMAVMTRRDFSAMHRLKTDETWHFYGGDAAELLVLHPGGRVERVRFGPDALAGEKPQVTVPAGSWMGARPDREAEEAYSFFGCTLAPGFAPEDYEPGYRDELQRGWPEAAQEIAALTRADSLTRPAAGAGVAPATRDGDPDARASGNLFGRVIDPGDAAEITVATGVTLRELAGRAGATRTEAVSLARFRLEAGASTGSSRYFGCDEFFVVLAGEGVAILSGADSPVRAGSVVVIARGEPHALRAGAGGPLEFLAVLAPAFDPARYAPER